MEFEPTYKEICENEVFQFGSFHRKAYVVVEILVWHFKISDVEHRTDCLSSVSNASYSLLIFNYFA